MKTLFFEGAGWAGADISKATVGNCRIRTAFHLDNGSAVYLELTGCEVTKNTAARLGEFAPYAGFVDHAFYIDGLGDDLNYPIMDCEREHKNFRYDHDGILRFVNSLGASFDAIEVLPMLAGYHVHAEKGGYNYADEFEHDRELTDKREAIRQAIYDMEKAELEADRASGAKKFVHSPSGKCYPNFSLWVDRDEPQMLHLLRHYNGFNKHWTIDASAEDWRATMKEAVLGRYGC